MYGIKVTGPTSDKWSGWAIRKGVDANFNIQVLVAGTFEKAEKFYDLDEAAAVAFLLIAQQSHLIGRVKILRLKRTELDRRWVVEAECTL